MVERTGEKPSVGDVPSEGEGSAAVAGDSGTVQDGRSDRNQLGQFVKGTRIKGNSPGRPARADIKPVLAAITEEIAPKEIRERLRWCLTESHKQGDIKMMLETIRFIAAYAIGKPVQRSITAQMDVQQFIDAFAPQNLEDEEPEYDIEA